MRTLKTKNRMLSLFQDDRIIAVIDTETTESIPIKTALFSFRVRNTEFGTRKWNK